MPLDKSVLRATAKAITHIPEHFQLVMEDNTSTGLDETTRKFIWEDPEDEYHGIEISLCLDTGQLMELDIHQEQDMLIVSSDPEIERAIEVSKGYMVEHHPDYRALTSVYAEVRRGYYYVQFRVEVGGLPLPHTGCEVKLDRLLRVVRYRVEESRGLKLPTWPAQIVNAQTSRQRIVKDLHMQLIITTLEPTLYEMRETNPQHHLVYEPVQGRRVIDAITGEPLYGLEHDLVPPSYPIIRMQEDNRKVALIDRNNMLNKCPDVGNDLIGFWEGCLGIDTERYVMDEPKEDEEYLILLYFDTWDVGDTQDHPQADPLSVDGYIDRTWPMLVGISMLPI
ncbi:hypothetical protein JCM10914A_50060 [Paenibacillus sp. JCM 10914]|uniref:YcdB/YcdC domain-containing protein n=1 Tax=Paenibacillus sp. JCM 10914 TaxID=1236974 RepID=UPI0003CC3EBA|nr:YcdB/YcdC domain-containing protein [Paenibacillus sp. JCM 10914]GAE08361.1 hypothetical Cytosolic Protein [Paenibacillus sp. JCM 10914]